MRSKSKLTFIKKLTKKDNNGSYYSLYQCECGKLKEAIPCHVNNGNNLSCGCLWKPHDFRGTRFYTIWKQIKQRCLDEHSKNYARYGRRGITICDKWLNFLGFYDDMHNDYFIKHGDKNRLQIDRIDNSDGYYKNNCRWVTSKDNNNNRRDNVLITSESGETKTLAQWAEIYQVRSSTARHRMLKLGMTKIADVFSQKCYKANHLGNISPL